MDLFNVLGIEKLKVHYPSQFQESNRILLSSMQTGLSRGTRAWFLLHFFVLTLGFCQSQKQLSGRNACTLPMVKGLFMERDFWSL